MEQYVIISIDDNNGGSDGHVIIVKANPVKEASGFAHLTKLFGKKYYKYSHMEDEETEIFVFPYSEERMQTLLDCAKDAEENKNFWVPNIDEFYDANIKMADHDIRPINKHISFKANTRKDSSGVKEIVDSMNFSNSLSDIFNEGSEKLTEVKNVPLNEGCVYTGKALQIGNICMPNGYGYKIYKSEGNKKVASFFKGGGIGNIAWLSYPKKYMYLGGVFDEEPNGWGFKLGRGQFTFGYYKGGKLYKDLSPFASDIFYSIQGKGIDMGHIESDINRLAFGLLPNENRQFEGFQFLENGTVYVGVCSNANEYDLTGRFIRFEIDGKATLGHFKNGEVVKSMSQKEYFKLYSSKGIGNEKIDLSTDYLSKPDNGLYLIVAMQTSYDLDMGPVIIINALPFDSLKMPQNGKISFDLKQMEYFYLHQEADVVHAIQESSQNQRLWKVNLDDYNNHFGYVQDMTSNDTFQRNYHLHNGLIGLDYSKIAVFDTKNVMTRLEEKSNSRSSDINIESVTGDELPF